MEDNIIDLQRKVKVLNDENNKMYKEIEILNKELQDTKEHLGEYLYEQEEENKELKKKIDKAIETINYYAIEDEDYSKIYNTEEQELLNILKGE